MEQLCLNDVNLKPKVIPLRPRDNTYEITHFVAYKLHAQLRYSLDDAPELEPYTPPTKEEVAAYESRDWEKSDTYFGDLVQALRDDYHWEGYSLAKYLDSHCGWTVSAPIVDTLDLAYCFKIDAHTECVRQWVINYELTLKYVLGDVVKFQSAATKPRNTWVTGKIVHVEADTLRYTVEVPSLGHGVEKTPGNRVIGSVVKEEELYAVGPQANLSEV